MVFILRYASTAEVQRDEIIASSHAVFHVLNNCRQIEIEVTLLGNSIDNKSTLCVVLCVACGLV